MDFETGQHRMAELRDWAKAKPPDLLRNEAKTRLDLVDRLLIECLGWVHEEIHVEERFEGQYSDYELGRGPRHVVIEAKREGETFELPAGFDRSSQALPQLMQDNPRLKDAVHQVLGYTQSRGIAIAAVSNGHQLVVFLGSRTDGVPPERGRALIFSSLGDMTDRFKELWDALSREGAESRRLSRQLDADSELPPPPKLSKRIVDYPGYKNRNPVAAELQILGGMFFEDILRQPEVETEFLKQCYTPSGSLSQYATVSREILKARYSIFSEAESEATLTPVRSKKAVSDELVSDVFAASLARRPIILLGDVGVGKTMFTRHFIKVEASDILERSLVLYVDFGSKPALAQDLTAYVRQEFRRQLLDEYSIDIDSEGFVRSVYRSDLQRFANGIFGSLKTSDPEAYRRHEIEHLQTILTVAEEHLRRSLEHLSKAQQRQAVVFLDNVDQRPFSFQEEVFLIAQSLASDWPVACFIALRPETFYRSKREGALTGYQPRVFTIDPPRVDRVILRRLAFAERELDRTGRLPTFPANLTVSSDRLGSYLKVLKRSVTHNEKLIEFIENMSGGNVRRALEFIVSFVGSGHVDTNKIFAAIERGGYDIPLHEFFRAVVYGEHEYFDPSDSPVANVFDISRPDGREHFLQPLIVSYIESAGSAGGAQGYVRTTDVYGWTQGLGFDARQVAFALNRSTDKDLLDTSPRYIQEQVRGADSERCRVTSIGLYTVKQLMPAFQYLDATSVDTPIIDAQLASELSPGLTIEERLERARAFVSYLSDQWSGFDGEDLPFDWQVVATQAARNLKDVDRGVRQSRRRSR